MSAADLDALRVRLARLGVDVSAKPTSTSEVSACLPTPEFDPQYDLYNASMAAQHSLPVGESVLQQSRPAYMSASLQPISSDSSEAQFAAENVDLGAVDLVNASVSSANKQEVMDILRRCNNIEKCLATAETVAIAAREAAASKAALGSTHVPSASTSFRSSPTRSAVFDIPTTVPNADDSYLESLGDDLYGRGEERASASPRGRRRAVSPLARAASGCGGGGSSKAARRGRSHSTSATARGARLSKAAAAAVTAASTAARVHCGSGCGTARLREAEQAWTQERGALRREAQMEHRRALLLEKELNAVKTAQRVRVCEVKQLRTALKERDLRLTDAENRLSALQTTQHDNIASQHKSLVSLMAEREDLLELLRVTLSKLEKAQAAADRSTAAGEILENQMRRATFNEKRAVDTAYRAAVVAEEAHEKEHEMQWSNRLMSNISELQRTHFKNKHEMLKGLLTNIHSSHLSSSDSLLEQDF
eukprot:CAMPEP_0114276482 /NCGR_PEP_ID=MMETSP0059-20121206/256_1 /TAXON_ID=36894 /ORGANISM="Pyramimonas parkeae, Strain CCMP726" /LENGTH=478 /DNA_ID=CAMNT_0001396475 /DNA_START=203 /DNA_END=1639 /DNA_ORIENTATION=-